MPKKINLILHETNPKSPYISSVPQCPCGRTGSVCRCYYSVAQSYSKTFRKNIRCAWGLRRTCFCSVFCLNTSYLLSVQCMSSNVFSHTASWSRSMDCRMILHVWEHWQVRQAACHFRSKERLYGYMPLRPLRKYGVGGTLWDILCILTLRSRYILRKKLLDPAIWAPSQNMT